LPGVYGKKTCVSLDILLVRAADFEMKLSSQLQAITLRVESQQMKLHSLALSTAREHPHSRRD
jgi:hypothetical protein